MCSRTMCASFDWAIGSPESPDGFCNGEVPEEDTSSRSTPWEARSGVKRFVSSIVHEGLSRCSSQSVADILLQAQPVISIVVRKRTIFVRT